MKVTLVIFKTPTKCWGDMLLTLNAKGNQTGRTGPSLKPEMEVDWDKQVITVEHEGKTPFLVPLGQVATFEVAP